MHLGIQYWKFRTVIDKAIAVANDKGMKIDDHFNQSVDMARLGSGYFRKVDAFHLSRMACLIIAENADGKKPMVLQSKLLLKYCYDGRPDSKFGRFQCFVL